MTPPPGTTTFPTLRTPSGALPAEAPTSVLTASVDAVMAAVNRAGATNR